MYHSSVYKCSLFDHGRRLILFFSPSPYHGGKGYTNNLELFLYLYLKEETIYEFSIYYAIAKMKIEDVKYIVPKGSTAVVQDRPSALPAIKKMRKSLVSSGVLRGDSSKELYEFTDDYIFNSPSYAAAPIAGGTENGRRQWKFNSKSLNDRDRVSVVDIRQNSTVL